MFVSLSVDGLVVKSRSAPFSLFGRDQGFDLIGRNFEYTTPHGVSRVSCKCGRGSEGSIGHEVQLRLRIVRCELEVGSGCDIGNPIRVEERSVCKIERRLWHG